MSVADEAQAILDEAGFGDWTVENDAVLISPNGHRVEWDGRSPDGEESPLLILGLI